MGEAKRRGSLDERVENARQRVLSSDEIAQIHADIYYNGASTQCSIKRLLDIWGYRAEQVCFDTGHGSVHLDTYLSLLAVFKTALRFTWDTHLSGACHNMSAAMYVVLKELGLNATLCIGEVKAGTRLFDHSWVEFESKVFDVALSYPLEHPSTRLIGGPTFFHTDLNTGKPTTLNYGVKSHHGMDEIARYVYSMSLADFADLQKNDGVDDIMLVWSIASHLARSAGLVLSPKDISEKYGAVKRTLKARRKFHIFEF